MSYENDNDSDPFAEGADAALAGESDTANPYPVGSDEALSWNDGWWDIVGQEEEDDEDWEDDEA